MKKNSGFSAQLQEILGDISYADLGAKVGISKQSIGSYINGKRQPKRPTLTAIANVFGVKPEWLNGFDVPKYATEANGHNTLMVTKNNSVDENAELLQLVHDFRLSSPEDRQLILRIASHTAQAASLLFREEDRTRLGLAQAALIQNAEQAHSQDSNPEVEAE